MIPLSLLFVLGSLGLLVWGLVATSQMLIWGSLAASIAAGVCLFVSVLLRRRFPAADGSSSPDLPPLPVDLPGPGTGSPALPPFGSPGAGHPGAAPASTGYPPADAGADRTSEDAPQQPPVGYPAVPPATGPTGRPDAGAGTSVEPADTGAPPPANGATSGAQMPPEQQYQDSTAATAAPGAARSAVEGSAEPGAAEVSTADANAADTGTAGAGAAAAGTSEPEPPQEDIAVAAALRAAQLEDEVLVIDGRPRYHLSSCAFVRGKPTVPLPLSTARRTGFTPCGLCCPDATLLARARTPRADG